MAAAIILILLHRVVYILHIGIFIGEEIQTIESENITKNVSDHQGKTYQRHDALLSKLEDWAFVILNYIIITKCLPCIYEEYIIRHGKNY